MGAKNFVNSKYKCHKTFPNLIYDIQQPPGLTTTPADSTDSDFFVHKNNYYCFVLHYKNVNK